MKTDSETIPSPRLAVQREAYIILDDSIAPFDLVVPADSVSP
jgi:hypothetical protein